MLIYILELLIITLVILPVCLLVRRPWREKSARGWAEAAFVVFMADLLALALQGEYQNPVRMAGAAVMRVREGDDINWIPFHTIISLCRDFHLEDFAVNVVGNVVLFMPWGFGLPLLRKRKQTVRSVILHSLALPVFIETFQLFIGRCVDVDDLILNFLGGCLGAGLYYGMRRILPDMDRLAR